MKFKPSLLTAAGVLFAVLAVAAPASRSQTFTTFDPHGSQSTSPVSINPAGQIVGNYYDGVVTHGFLRATDGTITSFDATGSSFPGTFPAAITPQGAIVGTYFGANFTQHIFLRAKDGTFTTIEIPTSGAIFVGELVANSEGEIAGEYIDSNGNPSVFLRSPSGKFTLFELPPTFNMSFFAPNITGLTPGGTLLGNYIDANFGAHGWLRTIDGNLTTFEDPNGGVFSFFAGPTSIDDSGIVTGFYLDTTKNNELRLFLRAPNGVFSSFDTPQLGSFGGAATINSSGAVAGYVQNFVCSGFICTSVPLSFLRSASGTVSPVNDPQAPQGTTAVLGINPAGVIFGTYADVNNVQHGFLRKP